MKRTDGINLLHCEKQFEKIEMTFVVVVWNDNSVTTIKQCKLVMPFGLTKGGQCRMQHGQALWEGVVDSFFGK